jgi:hypothetical protein
MQRKVLLTLALVLCLASSAQAVISISIGNYSVPAGNTVVNIPVFIDNTAGAVAVTATDVNISIFPNGQNGDGATFPAGPSPTLHFVGQNLGNPPAGDITGNIFQTAAHSFSDAGSDNYNILVFQNLGNPNAPIQTSANGGGGAGLWITLLADITGIGPGTYKIVAGALNGNGSSDFFNAANPVPVVITDGQITITVPEPASIVMGLFGAASLGFVAIRRRRARG